jgi:outer membrane protein TolC
MKNRTKLFSRFDLQIAAMVAACCLNLVAAPRLCAEPLPLKRAVELALAHSTTSAIAAADDKHAREAVRELHANYIPQFTIGAGLGYSWGFPLSLEGSAPSLFNLNASSAIYNAPLVDAIRASRHEVQSVSASSKDRRNEVIQDTVISYAELSKWEERIAHLRTEQEAANKFEEAMAERMKEGVESALERTKAQLGAARVRLRLAEAEGSADVLREHLAKLTGMPSTAIETSNDSIPAFPRAAAEQDVATVADANPSVISAVEHARAQFLRAQAEHKAFRPSLDFATQYARLAKYNHYDVFFAHYEPNNASLGVVIRFPILNYSQRAKAREADADALKARKEAEAAKNKVSEETLRLQRTVRQMEAAEEVARLEYEISLAELDATTTRMDAGKATLHDLNANRAQMNEHFITLQDVTFELERARIGLLRTTGELEGWALGQNSAPGGQNP